MEIMEDELDDLQCELVSKISQVLYPPVFFLWELVINSFTSVRSVIFHSSVLRDD